MLFLEENLCYKTFFNLSEGKKKVPVGFSKEIEKKVTYQESLENTVVQGTLALKEIYASHHEIASRIEIIDTHTIIGKVGVAIKEIPKGAVLIYPGELTTNEIQNDFTVNFKRRNPFKKGLSIAVKKPYSVSHYLMHLPNEEELPFISSKKMPEETFKQNLLTANMEICMVMVTHERGNFPLILLRAIREIHEGEYCGYYYGHTFWCAKNTSPVLLNKAHQIIPDHEYRRMKVTVMESRTPLLLEKDPVNLSEIYLNLIQNKGIYLFGNCIWLIAEKNLLKNIALTEGYNTEYFTFFLLQKDQIQLYQPNHHILMIPYETSIQKEMELLLKKHFSEFYTSHDKTSWISIAKSKGLDRLVFSVKLEFVRDCEDDAKLTRFQKALIKHFPAIFDPQMHKAFQEDENKMAEIPPARISQ